MVWGIHKHYRLQYYAQLVVIILNNVYLLSFTFSIEGVLFVLLYPLSPPEINVIYITMQGSFNSKIRQNIFNVSYECLIYLVVVHHVMMPLCDCD